ncbi:hypothetical protein GMOD_00008376 [Pyrenophora seminiperda CCB06]|uniref:Uncharacterized protein n=1 Tax=Pyrenophora seminiperda CCB06 TaxID=1302712 RepID=A0A3M7M2L9_9PLEO|nr:hypothetical protein GMOD_00008376 [Pyrenophora seminiperda CCB06]
MADCKSTTKAKRRAPHFAPMTYIISNEYRVRARFQDQHEWLGSDRCRGWSKGDRILSLLPWPGLASHHHACNAKFDHLRQCFQTLYPLAWECGGDTHQDLSPYRDNALAETTDYDEAPKRPMTGPSLTIVRVHFGLLIEVI